MSELTPFPIRRLLSRATAIIKVTATPICRSDLRLYGGEMPTMESGDVLGHEFMGEVMEVGSGAAGPLKPGDRVVVPFTISCGSCFFCQRRLFSLCDTSNPNAEMARNVMDIPPQAYSFIPICWTRSFCRDRFDMEYWDGVRAFQ